MAQCIVCGKSFEEKSYKSNKYCSMACYRIAQKSGVYKRPKQPNTVCEVCGKSFVLRGNKKTRKGNVSSNRFCSRTCYLKYHKQKLYKHICKYCGKEFEKPALTGRNTYEFCGDTCRRAYFAQRTLKKCEVCGQAFYPWAYENIRDRIILDKEVRTCSKKCRKLLKKRNEDIRRDKISLAFGGDKHPNWAGGKNR
ncbi:MAG: hypothetical protein LBR98_02565, partial [Syntrophomonadaceae bacterium]|nr:hypothetical protein [Syntrophomonadaceae bacterium]